MGGTLGKTHGRRRAETISKAARTIVALAIASLVIGFAQTATATASSAVQGLDPALDVTATASCALGAGRIDVAVSNNGPTPLVVQLAVLGLDSGGVVDHRFVVEAFSTDTTTATGRSNGRHEVKANGEIVAVVEVDCLGEISDPFDRLAQPAALRWWLDDDRATTALSLSRGDFARTTEPDEPLGCTFEDGGTTWFRVAAPAGQVEVETANGFGVAIHVSASDSPGFGDLENVGCIEPNALGSVTVTRGDLLYMQASGPISDARNVRVATLTSTHQLPAGIEIVDFSTRCITSGGVISTTLRNTSDEAQTVQIQPYRYPQRTLKSITLSPGATGTTEVSGRADGLYELYLNGIEADRLLWVGCDADGPNDTIATATEVTFVDQQAFVPRSSNVRYSYGRDEAAAAAASTPCFRLDLASDGSAWSTFVAPEAELSLLGNDDQVVALFRPRVDNPLSLDDVEQVFCGDGDSENIPVIAGERYWMMTADEAGDVTLLAQPTPPIAPNDALAAARELNLIDVVAETGGTVDSDAGETTTPCSSESGSLWWTTVWGPETHIDVSSGGAAIWSAEVDDPTYEDLELVDCARRVEGADLEVGRRYWIQTSAPRRGGLAVTAQQLIEVDSQVICPDGGPGIIEQRVTNGFDIAIEIEVELSDSRRLVSARDVRIEPGEMQTVRWGGRLDGVYGTQFGNEFLNLEQLAVRHDVECVERSQPIEVVTSCLNGSGRIDIYFTSDTDASRRVELVGRSSLITRSVRVLPDETRRITITGRRNGTYMVEIYESNQFVVPPEEITIDC